MNKPGSGEYAIDSRSELPWQAVSLDVLREKYAKGAERDLDGAEMVRAVRRQRIVDPAAGFRRDAFLVHPQVAAPGAGEGRFQQCLAAFQMTRDGGFHGIGVVQQNSGFRHGS